MSEDITVTIKGQRGSPPALTTIASGIVWQLDKVSSVEATGYGSAEPHYSYQAYTTQLPMSNTQLLLEGDLLIDKLLDPYTSNPRQFRIVNDPEFFPLDGHVECLVYKYRGR